MQLVTTDEARGDAARRVVRLDLPCSIFMALFATVVWKSMRRMITRRKEDYTKLDLLTSKELSSCTIKVWFKVHLTGQRYR